MRTTRRALLGSIALVAIASGPLRAQDSVSADVVDKATCAVLVARQDAVSRVLVAVDGSPSSWRAVDHVGGAGYLKGLPVDVLAVQPHSRPVPEMPPEVAAARATERLQLDGLHVRWTIRRGDPVREITEAADELGCDLVAVGTRGETGLSRLVHGSVAHGVLLHARASVLVVHEPVRERSVAREQLRVGVPLTAMAGAAC